MDQNFGPMLVGPGYFRFNNNSLFVLTYGQAESLFIGDNTDRAMEVQEIVEACSKKMEGRLLVVGTGQSALHDTPTLQRYFRPSMFGSSAFSSDPLPCF